MRAGRRLLLLCGPCLLLPLTALAQGVTASPAAPDNAAPAFHSLANVLQWSYVHNPDLRSDRAAFQAVEEDLPQAQAGYKPTVTATGNLEEEHLNVGGKTLSDFASAGGGDGGISSHINATGTIRTAQAQVAQPLYRGGRTVAAIDSANNAIAAQRALVIDEGQQVLLQVATAYMNVVRDQLVVQANESNIADLTEQFQATQSRFKVGSTTRTDLAQAESALASAQAELTAQRGNLKVSRATFEQLVGYPPGDVNTPQVSFPIPATLDETAAAADAQNPQIIAATYLQKSSVSDIARIRGELLPQLSLIGAVARTNEPAPGLSIHETSESAALQGSWTLYEGGAIRSRVRQASQTANQRTIDILATRRQVRQQVVSAWENLAAIRAELTSRQAQVNAAALSAKGTRAQAEVGSRSVLDSLDTEQLFLNARVALVQAQRDEVVATFTLAATLGLLTPQVLGFPEVALDDSREPADAAVAH